MNLYVVAWAQTMTVLDNVMYVVYMGSNTIKTYTADTFEPLGRDIHGEEMYEPISMVACRDDRQLYVADSHYTIFRVSADDQSYVKWLTPQVPIDDYEGTPLGFFTLSVTPGRLVVTSPNPPALHQYSTADKQLLRDVPLPSCVKKLKHGVETSRGTFVIAYSGGDSWEDDAVSKRLYFCHLLLAPT